MVRYWNYRISFSINQSLTISFPGLVASEPPPPHQAKLIVAPECFCTLIWSFFNDYFATTHIWITLALLQYFIKLKPTSKVLKKSNSKTNSELSKDYFKIFSRIYKYWFKSTSKITLISNSKIFCWQQEDQSLSLLHEQFELLCVRHI